MFARLCMAAVLVAASVLLTAAPASAQGEILITQAKANAGNVTPGDPAGFPVILSQPGAYILGSNLQVPAGQIGLQVQAHNVDIDMNGFRLSGANSSGAAAGAYGVYSAFGQSRIHDGVITGFRFDGIRLAGNVNAWSVENMQIIQNQGNGIYAEESAYARYLHNSVVANGGFGIFCGDYCYVEGSSMSDNGGHGVAIRSGTVMESVIFSNDGFGISDSYPPLGDTGIGNNTVAGNNAGGTVQTVGTTDLQPNVCLPNPCN
jgi:hypothetical protein